VRPRRRNRELTRERILATAYAEFSQRGYTGARIDSIARRSGANVRMIYHYFGGKDALYVAVLEHGLQRLRFEEQDLVVSGMAPVPGLLKLFDFVFDHFASHPELVHLLSGENLQKAVFLRRSRQVPKMSPRTLAIIESLLARARPASGAQLPDPLQIYVTMVALSYFHISNAHTLSYLFRSDLQNAQWLAARRQHVRAVLEHHLRALLG
jgi:TetR/AcrR family transcriptional regulator